MLLLLGFLGLSLDAAFVRKSGQELQAAADAAALAAAALVIDDDPDADFPVTRQEAIDVALANQVANDDIQIDANWSNDPAGDIVVGTWDRFAQTFTPTIVDPDAVRVTARRTPAATQGNLALQFGSAFGASQAAVSRSAIAHFGGDWGAAVIILHPTMQGALDIRGNAELHVPNDGIQVNSTDSQAFWMNGQPDVPRVRARRINVVGNYRVPSGSCYPMPHPFSDPIPDPLAGLPYPDPAGMTDYGSIQSAGTYQPGFYPGGIDFNGGTARLNPGVYYLGPPGINLNGDALLQGDGVMLYLARGGQVRISGNSPGIDVSGPSSGTYQGVVVFQHRLNTLPTDISGGGLFDVRGTIYMAGAALSMDGNVDREVGRIIVSSQQLRGTADYTITGIGHPPGGPKSSYLVK